MYWSVLNTKNDTITCSESFVVEYVPKEMKKFRGNTNILSNIYRIQTYDSIIFGFFCTGFVNFMLNNKSLIDFTSLFSTNDLKENYEKIYFQ